MSKQGDNFENDLELKLDMSSGGISSGIHMSFRIIEKLFGSEIVLTTAKRMEYDL